MFLPKGAFSYNFNQLEDTSIWETPFEQKISQTSKGMIQGDSFFYSGEFSIVGYRTASASLLSTGAMPKGYCGFGFSISKKPKLVGQDKNADGIIGYVHENTEFRSHSPTHFSNYFAIYNVQALEQHLNPLDILTFKKLQSLLNSEILRSRRHSSLIINKIRQIANFTPLNQFEINGLSYRDFEHDVIAKVLQIYEDHTLMGERLNKRSRIVSKAVDFICHSALDEITILDIATAVNTSQRNLELAFSSILDTTPKVFLAGYRLSAIRSQILAHRALPIKDIARRYGVTHMGHFAAAYRSYFGESPMQTRTNAAR